MKSRCSHFAILLIHFAALSSVACFVDRANADILSPSDLGLTPPRAVGTGNIIVSGVGAGGFYHQDNSPNPNSVVPTQAVSYSFGYVADFIDQPSLPVGGSADALSTGGAYAGHVDAVSIADTNIDIAGARSLSESTYYDGIALAVPLNGNQNPPSPMITLDIHINLFGTVNGNGHAFQTGTPTSGLLSGRFNFNTQGVAPAVNLGLPALAGGPSSEEIDMDYVAPVQLNGVGSDSTYAYYVGNLVMDMSTNAIIDPVWAAGGVEAFGFANVSGWTLPDGSTPESHNMIVEFASGYSLPNHAVPEPTSLTLAGLGIISTAYCGYRRRCRQQKSVV